MFVVSKVRDRKTTEVESSGRECNKVSRKEGCVMTSNEVNFVFLADNFTVQYSNLLKLPSGMENETA